MTECRSWDTEHFNSVLVITVTFLGIDKWEPDIYIGFSPDLHLQCILCTVFIQTLSFKVITAQIKMTLCDKFIFVTLRKVEVAEGIGDLGAGIGEPFEYLEKEDMSDMFRRAMLEKMQFVGR